MNKHFLCQLTDAVRMTNNKEYVKQLNYCKWFEPRSISSLLSVIVRVSIVLKRTVVVDND